MAEQFINGRISPVEPGYSDMQNFLMQKSPGPYGVMLGGSAEKLPLPASTFLDVLKTGLAEDDRASMLYLYGNLIELTACRRVNIGFNR